MLIRSCLSRKGMCRRNFRSNPHIKNSVQPCCLGRILITQSDQCVCCVVRASWKFLEGDEEDTEETEANEERNWSTHQDAKPTLGIFVVQANLSDYRLHQGLSMNKSMFQLR